MRVGIGYDMHPLVRGRPLILGGVRIDHETGLEGHSDADALIHAICDALLGALSLGDIGEHFPETEENRDISSLEILSAVSAMVAGRGYRSVNIDCIIHAEAPRITPHKKAMAMAIADALGIEHGAVSIKATGAEGLGPIGEGRAIAASAVALLESLTAPSRADGGVSTEEEREKGI